MNFLKTFLFLVLTLFIRQFGAAQNVGVGTTNPLKKLHVEGTTYIKDSLGIGVTDIKANLHVGGLNGLLVTGEYDNGSPLGISGSGTRMFFYPKKAAFRAGTAFSNLWDDNNIGILSVAFGYSTKASGMHSFAAGIDAVASGNYSRAMGNTVDASGDYSTALGSAVSTSSQYGSFIIGDNSAITIYNSSAPNQMSMRFAGGYRFSTSSTPLFSPNEGLFVKPGGNVGVGVADPNAKLEVAGTIKIGTQGTVMNNVQNGVINAGQNFTGGVKTLTLTFPNAFTTVPKITTTVQTDDFTDIFLVNVKQVTTTGCTLMIYRVDNGGGTWGQFPNINWMAWE